MRAQASVTPHITAAHLCLRQRFAVESGTVTSVELLLRFGKPPRKRFNLV
jgi:hypothetical protein